MTAKRSHRADSPDDAVFIENLFATASPANWMTGGQSRVWRPPTDVYETEAEIVVQVEVAGSEHTDFYLSLDERRLSIRGVRYDPMPERRSYYQMEIHFGEFSSEVDLPGPVDKDQVQAEYHDGFLRVTLVKVPPDLSLRR